MKKIQNILLLVGLLLISGQVFAQDKWKTERHSVYGAAGVTAFMGDLGGGKKDAAHFFGLRDIDLKELTPAVAVGYRCRVFEPLSVRANLGFSMLKGDDKASGKLDRQLRNLNFKSTLFEMGLNIDYYFLKEKDMPRYSQSSIFSLRKLSAYVFTGFSAFHFNPKGEYEGTWYKLQPLGTEGQGSGVDKFQALDIEGNVVTVQTKDPYKLWAFAIPIGIGVKYGINKKLAISLELSNRYTTTDYLDDVSSPYYFNYSSDTDVIGNPITPKASDEAAKYLCDKHLLENGTMDTEKKQTGALIRANNQYNDAYVQLMIGVHYKFTGRVHASKPKYY